MRRFGWIVVLWFALGALGACVREVVLTPPPLDGGDGDAVIPTDAVDGGVDDGAGGD